jgi:hypothetical protein
MKYLVLSFFLISFNFAKSQELPLYYGSHFLAGYQDHSLKNEELKSHLFDLLSGGHVKNENTPDTILPNCNSASVDEARLRCVEHHALGYSGARQKLFGMLHLKQIELEPFSVKDVYCERTYTDADFDGQLTFGPNIYPHSGNIINTEHTWPQSRFTGKFPNEMQKSDLHHLFPTDSEMNSRRASLKFGNVKTHVENLKCPQNKLGQQEEGGVVFEVNQWQRGNTARAIFYFATRYKMKISPSEEAALRQWNIEDPVDAEEFTRNEQIESLQGNRNPYIDFADLIDRVNNFE